MDKKYSLKEAADILGINSQKLKEAIKNKELKAEKEKVSEKGFKYLIPEEELIIYGKEIGIDLIIEEDEEEEVIEEREDESELTIKYQEALQKIAELEKKLEENEELRSNNEQLSKELELANEDFNEQVKEYEELLKDYEKLEEKKKRQDVFISEAEQTILDMIEQYKELAKDVDSRDKIISQVNRELEEIKKTQL